jgi:RES domain-containing protein
MVDSRTVARIDEVSPVAFSGRGFRHLDPSRNPLSGTGARIFGGRWNPPESFPVIYLGLSKAVVEAEFLRMAALQGRDVHEFLPRAYVTYGVSLHGVLDLRLDETRLAVGLSEADLFGLDRERCRSVGDAAHYLALEGILAPSATRAGEVLAVFNDRLGADSSVEVLATATWTAPPSPVSSET